MKLRLAAFGPLLGLALTWFLFATLAGSAFTSWGNFQLMLVQTAVVGVAAVGATWIIIGGGIDLSVGSAIALSGMVGAAVQRASGSPAVTIAATIAAGVGTGWLIGALVVGQLLRVALSLAAAALAGALASALPAAPWIVAAAALLAATAVWWATRRFERLLPLSPFIITLGLWGALRGLAKGLGHNQPIYFDPAPVLAGLMQSSWLVPPGVLVMVLVAGLAALLLRRTVFGRHATAMGHNRETARLSGVDVLAVERTIYVLAGACTGVAALLQLSFLSMGDPTTAQGHELKAIAAAVIGGASLSGGAGSIAGTLLGAFLMTVVDNGCTKLGFDNWVQEVVTGAIIVAAVAIDRARQVRR